MAPPLTAPRRPGRLVAALAAVVVAVASAGCSDGDASEEPASSAGPGGAAKLSAEASGRILRVPSSYGTIQAAVDASRPGDLVLIAPGIYHEEVEVTDENPGIVIRGVDRNRVVLDGRNRLADGIHVEAAGVAVENLTVRGYEVNGVIWLTPGEYADQGRYISGWRGSYITAYNNGLYGVYAFGVQHGRFDNVYASGHPDSGLYIGRCKPCHAVVTDSTAELNHVGLEFTNASGDVVVTDNVSRRNRVGIQVNSLNKERTAPQTGIAIEGNAVSDNQERRSPRGSEGFGAGIVINGGSDSVVRGNRVVGHDAVGIAVLDNGAYRAHGNRVERNRLAANAVDLALQPLTATSGGNCFAGNRPRTTVPGDLERVARCGRSVRIAATRLPRLPSPPQVDYRQVRPPAAQPNMANARTAPARPAVGRPEATR